MKPLDLHNPKNASTVAVIVLVLLWFIVILPIQKHYKAKLLDLNPVDVDRVELQTEYRADTSIPEATAVLTKDERWEFLKLLAECHLTALNHPRGLWVCTATISTKGRVFQLSIHNTSNNGVYIPLYSNGATGRNIGDFHNDELAPFITRILFKDAISRKAYGLLPLLRPRTTKPN